MRIPTLEECEEAIGEAAKRWAGRCFEIASKIVEAGLVSRERGLGGEAVYGHWIGPVSTRSYFADRRHLGFIQHGWINVETHGMVIDPTRWAFEGKRPYIFADYETDDITARCRHCRLLKDEHDRLGASDKCDLYEAELWPYDEGGNRWRAATMIRKPPPTLAADAKIVTLKLKPDTAKFVAVLLGQEDGRRVSAEQVFWLANLPYQVLAASDIAAIYGAICDVESYYIEFIPIDNRKRAKREAGFAWEGSHERV